MKPAKEVARFLIARKILRPIDAELENWTLARVDSLIDNTIACIEDAERDAWRAAADALRDLPTGEVICWDEVADDLIRHFEDWNKGRETNRADQTARAEEAERVRWTRPGTFTEVAIEFGRYLVRWQDYPNIGQRRWKDCGPASPAIAEEIRKLLERLEKADRFEEEARSFRQQLEECENRNSDLARLVVRIATIRPGVRADTAINEAQKGLITLGILEKLQDLLLTEVLDLRQEVERLRAGNIETDEERDTK